MSGALRRAVGFLPQRVACYPELTSRENLDWCARLHGIRGRQRRAAIDERLMMVPIGPSSSSFRSAWAIIRRAKDWLNR